jgi:hypothetical protein
MRLSLVLFALARLAAADTTPTQGYSASAPTGCPGIPFCYNSFSFDVQQFDPSLGTLLSIGFNFLDTETVSWSLFGDGTSGLLTVGSSASSSLPPILTSQASNYPVFPPCDITPCSGVATNALGTSGTFFSNAFVGTGTLAIDFGSVAELGEEGIFFTS